MSTVSRAIECKKEDPVQQGDIFENVKYNYIESEDNDTVKVIQYEFPYAIVVSQGCDVISMSEMASTKKGKVTKFMPSILMCPIYDVTMAKQGNHVNKAFDELGIMKIQDQLFTSEERKIFQKDWHYRYHALEVECSNGKGFKDSIIDFKHYFTVPMGYLLKSLDQRLFRLDDIYAEQITLKFATFLSRVAMPDLKEKG